MRNKINLILLVFIFSSCVKKEKSSNFKIPEILAGKTISERIEGKNALKAINQLHRTSIPIQHGIIAFYGKNREIILYMFEAENSDKADSLLQSMVKKMKESKGPFLPPEEVAHEKFKISPLYVTYGLGQGHFFFRLDKTLFWLSANTSLAFDAIKDLERSIFK